MIVSLLTKILGLVYGIMGLLGIWWCLSYGFDPEEKHEKPMLWHLWDAIKVIYHGKLYKK